MQVLLVLLALLALPGPRPLARQQTTGELPDEVGGAEVGLARERLRAGGDETVLAIHARRLIDADDRATLSEVLLRGETSATRAVLKALCTTEHIGLLPELLAVATGHPAAEVRSLAVETLQHLAGRAPAVGERLVGWLAGGTLPEAQLSVSVGVLGYSRDLRAVPLLLEQLGGPRDAEAEEALARLTGHECDGRAEWSLFWTECAGLQRDELLERALLQQRQTSAEALARMREEVVASRIERMGQDVDKLVQRLSDEYAAVRLEAARKLGGHPNVEQAASAVPALLGRLGNGTGGATHSNGHASGGAPRGEADPAVRTAVINALGVLGRGDPRVQQVLLDELASADGELAAVTVEAFARVRDQPDVVPPLLGYLQRTRASEDTVVRVLGVVASNRPAGVLDELEAWLAPGQSPRVRAAAVRAALASHELGDALDRVAPLTDDAEVRDVRYTLAQALGERLRGLPAEDDSRARMLELLAQLVEDSDPSVRASAASALGEGADDMALAVLEQRARAETDSSVMERILSAIGRLGRLQGVDTLGRVCASWVGESPELLHEAARRALQTIGAEQPSETWVAMADTLLARGAWDLARWVLQEALRRLEGSVDGRDALALLRGRLAVVDARSGRHEEARTLLAQLHETSAPYPPASERLELLASCCESLGRWGEAADWWLQRLDILPAGDGARRSTQRRAALALVSADRHEQAEALLRELLDADAGDNELLLALALTHAAQGDDGEARVVLHRLLDRLPVDEAPLREEVQRVLDELDGVPGAPAEGALVAPGSPGAGGGAAGDGAPAEPAAGDAADDGRADGRGDGEPDEGGGGDDPVPGEAAAPGARPR